MPPGRPSRSPACALRAGRRGDPRGRGRARAGVRHPWRPRPPARRGARAGGRGLRAAARARGTRWLRRDARRARAPGGGPRGGGLEHRAPVAGTLRVHGARAPASGLARSGRVAPAHRRRGDRGERDLGADRHDAGGHLDDRRSRRLRHVAARRAEVLLDRHALRRLDLPGGRPRRRAGDLRRADRCTGCDRRRRLGRLRAAPHRFGDDRLRRRRGRPGGGLGLPGRAALAHPGLLPAVPAGGPRRDRTGRRRRRRGVRPAADPHVHPRERRRTGGGPAGAGRARTAVGGGVHRAVARRRGGRAARRGRGDERARGGRRPRTARCRRERRLPGAGRGRAAGAAGGHGVVRGRWGLGGRPDAGARPALAERPGGGVAQPCRLQGATRGGVRAARAGAGGRVGAVPRGGADAVLRARGAAQRETRRQRESRPRGHVRGDRETVRQRESRLSGSRSRQPAAGRLYAQPSSCNRASSMP